MGGHFFSSLANQSPAGSGEHGEVDGPASRSSAHAVVSAAIASSLSTPEISDAKADVRIERESESPLQPSPAPSQFLQQNAATSAAALQDNDSMVEMSAISAAGAAAAPPDLSPLGPAAAVAGGPVVVHQRAMQDSSGLGSSSGTLSVEHTAGQSALDHSSKWAANVEMDASAQDGPARLAAPNEMAPSFATSSALEPPVQRHIIRANHFHQSGGPAAAIAMATGSVTGPAPGDIGLTQDSSFAANAYCGVPRAGSGFEYAASAAQAMAGDGSRIRSGSGVFPASALNPALSVASNGLGMYGKQPPLKSSASAAESFKTAAGDAETPLPDSPASEDPANFGIAHASSVHSGSDADLSGIGDNTTSMYLANTSLFGATKGLPAVAAPAETESHLLSDITDTGALSNAQLPGKAIVWWKNPLTHEHDDAGPSGAITSDADPSASLRIPGRPLQEVTILQPPPQPVLALQGRSMSEIAAAVLPERPPSGGGVPPPLAGELSALLPPPSQLSSRERPTLAFDSTTGGDVGAEHTSLLPDPVAGVSVQLQDHDMNISTMQDTLGASSFLHQGGDGKFAGNTANTSLSDTDAQAARSRVGLYDSLPHGDRSGFSTAVTDPLAHVDVRMTHMIHDSDSNLLLSTPRPSSGAVEGPWYAATPPPSSGGSHYQTASVRPGYLSSAPTSGSDMPQGHFTSFKSTLPDFQGNRDVLHSLSSQGQRQLSMELMGSLHAPGNTSNGFGESASSMPQHGANPSRGGAAAPHLPPHQETGESALVGSTSMLAALGYGGESSAIGSQLHDVEVDTFNAPSAHLPMGGPGMSTELMDSGHHAVVYDASAHITHDSFSAGRALHGGDRPRADTYAAGPPPFSGDGGVQDGLLAGGGVARSPRRRVTDTEPAVLFTVPPPLPLPPPPRSQNVDFSAQLSNRPAVPPLNLQDIRDDSTAQSKEVSRALQPQEARADAAAEPLQRERLSHSLRPFSNDHSVQLPEPSGISATFQRGPQLPEQSEAISGGESSSVLPAAVPAIRGSQAQSRLAQLFGDDAPRQGRAGFTKLPQRAASHARVGESQPQAHWQLRTTSGREAPEGSPVRRKVKAAPLHSPQGLGGWSGNPLDGSTTRDVHATDVRRERQLSHATSDGSVSGPKPSSCSSPVTNLSFSAAMGNGGWSLSEGLERPTTPRDVIEASDGLDRSPEQRSSLDGKVQASPRPSQRNSYAAKPPLSGGSSTPTGPRSGTPPVSPSPSPRPRLRTPQQRASSSPRNLPAIMPAVSELRTRSIVRNDPKSFNALLSFDAAEPASGPNDPFVMLGSLPAQKRPSESNPDASHSIDIEMRVQHHAAIEADSASTALDPTAQLESSVMHAQEGGTSLLDTVQEDAALQAAGMSEPQALPVTSSPMPTAFASVASAEAPCLVPTASGDSASALTIPVSVPVGAVTAQPLWRPATVSTAAAEAGRPPRASHNGGQQLAAARMTSSQLARQPSLQSAGSRPLLVPSSMLASVGSGSADQPPSIDSVSPRSEQSTERCADGDVPLRRRTWWSSIMGGDKSSSANLSEVLAEQ
jgi:hypothetical protein